MEDKQELSEAFVDDFMEHHGVKGMKWGVRKEQKLVKKQAKKLAKSQKKYDRKVRRNWVTAHNSAADYANKVLIPKINKKYAKYDFSELNTPAKKKAYDRYINEHNDNFAKKYNEVVVEMFGKRPT